MLLEALSTTGWPLVLRPQLPPGKGGLILIAGGLAVLWSVLLWLWFVPRRSLPPAPSIVTLDATLRPMSTQRLGAQGFVTLPRTKRRGPRPSTRVPRRPETAWRSAVEAAARRGHLGHIEVMKAAPDKCIILLHDCNSCRRRAPRKGCRSERQRLDHGLAAVLPGCLVREIRCRAGGAGRCAFLIQGVA